MTAQLMPVRQLVSAIPPWLAAAAIAVIAVLLMPQGADWPAQHFRVELFRQEGFELWNGQWYSGHPTAGYSVLFPPLGALFGITVVGVASVMAATICFHKLARGFGAPYARLASLVLGVALVPNLIVGRITFGLGVAIGLAALLAMQKRRWSIGGILAIATPLASPVAGVFLAMAVGAWAISEFHSQARPIGWRLVLMLGLAVAPMAAIAVVFPSDGTFGFPLEWVLATVVACAFVFVFARHAGFTALMIGAAIYAVAAVLVMVIPNPLGGNMWRLAMFFAVPVILLVLPHRIRYLAGMFAVVGLAWAWQPAFTSAANVQGDPSASREFHEPLIRQISAAPGQPGRLEIPFTMNHWETFYVAAELPIARGWERQADRELNALFYEPTLNAEQYREWLSVNAVRWVAVPQVEFDHGARTEVGLIEQGPPWLNPVWSNENWQLFEVVGASPFASSPARGITYESTKLGFTMPRRGAVRVQVRHSRHWSVTAGEGCVAKSSDDMLLVLVREPGRIELQQGFYPSSAC